MFDMQIIHEHMGHDVAIRAVTTAAFTDHPHSAQTEAAIVDALRVARALTLSLVAIDDEILVGHAAFSPVTIDGADIGWFGLGPVSVLPARQGGGIGSMLIMDGLEKLRAQGARGCVVLGDPDYYRRFGFQCHPGLRYGDAPPEYFMAQSFDGNIVSGNVEYHPGFGAK